MGRSRRIRFVVRVRAIRGIHTDAEWKTRVYGRATDTNLAKYVQTYHESLKPGGVNEHIGENGQLMYAEVYDYDTDTVLARWNH